MSSDRKAMSGFVKTHPGDVAVHSLHLNDSFQSLRSIRVAEEMFGLNWAGMIGDTIIHRDHPILGAERPTGTRGPSSRQGLPRVDPTEAKR